MSLTSLSVIMTVFVLNLHHRGPSKQAVPLWLRNMFLGRVSRWLCLAGGETPYKDYLKGDTAQFLRKVSLKMTIENMAQELKDDLENGMTDTILDPSGISYNEKQETRPNTNLSNDHYRKGNNKSTRNTTKTNDEILRALKRLIEKHDREDQEYEIIQEWRRVAQVVDRVLFWIFLTGTLVSTLTVLVIAPLTRSF